MRDEDFRDYRLEEELSENEISSCICCGKPLGFDESYICNQCSDNQD